MAEEALLSLISSCGIDNLELEWRLGTHTPTSFVSGVREHEWTALRQHLDASTEFTDSVCTERVVAGTPPGTKLVSSGTLTWWKTKTKIFNYDLPPHLRISASTEITQFVDGTSVPHGPGYTRFKERRSYIIDCWSVDVTRVMITSDIDSDTCAFEVEIELHDKEILFVRPAWYIIQSGNALAEKMISKMISPALNKNISILHSNAT
jgi:hypothetical protein